MLFGFGLAAVRIRKGRTLAQTVQKQQKISDSVAPAS